MYQPPFFWYNDGAAKYTDRIGENMQMTKAEFQIVKESDREKTERDVLHIIRCKNMLIKCSAQFPFRPIFTTKMD